MERRKGSWRIACATLLVGVWAANASFAQGLEFELLAGGGEDTVGPALQANLASAGDLVYDAQGNLYVSLHTRDRIRRIAPDGTITTFAGSLGGFAGDGGQASAARLDGPRGMVFDATGNLYVTDTGNRRIRRIAPDGTITTYAGNGGNTTSGDGGPAINASFASMERIAIDAAGNLYVTESAANRVRKITPEGVISTFAGNGGTGNVGNGGPATSASLDPPLAVAVGTDGSVYIGAYGAVRIVAPDGTIRSAVTLEYSLPDELTIGPDGHLYINQGGDVDCAIVRYPTPMGSGTPTIVAGLTDAFCGPTADGELAAGHAIGQPDGIAFDAAGNLVYSDWDTGQIRRVDATTGVLGTIAGSTGAYADGRDAMGAPLGILSAIAVDAADNVLLSDGGYRRVHRISTAGTIESPAGTGWGFVSWNYDCDPPGCPGKSFPIAGPAGIAPGDAAGEILVADNIHNRIYRISATGMVLTAAGTSSGIVGETVPALSAEINPHGMARAPSGALYFATPRWHVVQRLHEGMVGNVAGNMTRGFSGDGGLATQAQMSSPNAVAVDSAGNVYVSENGSMRVRRFTPGGTITTIAGNGLPGVSGDGGFATGASVGQVGAIAMHGGTAYIASEGKLRRVDADGIIHGMTGMPYFVTGLAVRNDILYVATLEGRVYRAALPALTVRPVAHDYDGDGHSDILWRNKISGANAVWREADHATQLTVTGVTNQAWKIVGQGDFDADGTDDIVWRNASTGVNTIWRSANSATQITMPTVTLSWSIVGVGDFDGDGADDLLWRNGTTGANAVWRSGNSTTQIPVTGVTNLQWRIVGVGDFDDDGKSDILWRNTTTGLNAIWRSANSATQLPVTGVTNLAWKVQGVGDFDGDGRSDLFWRNAQTGVNTIWDGAQNTSQRAVTAVTGSHWSVVAVGDYDGDGSDDLLWRNGIDGRNGLWRSGNATTQVPVVGVTNTAWTIVPYTNQL